MMIEKRQLDREMCMKSWSTRKHMRSTLANKHESLVNLYFGQDDARIDCHTHAFVIEPTKNPQMQLHVVDMTTTEAIFAYGSNHQKTAILDFASYRYPGGGYINGAMAQEEALCHDSTLYHFLKDQVSFYRRNNDHLNHGLYHNRMLYLHGIRFFHPDYPLLETSDIQVVKTNSKVGDVIVVAAPNKREAVEHQGISESDNDQTLHDRITFILDGAQYHHVDTLILGAFGCGVFAQDPFDVARLFKDGLTNGSYGFNHVIFAIPNGNGNLDAFHQIIG